MDRLKTLFQFSGVLTALLCASSASAQTITPLGQGALPTGETRASAVANRGVTPVQGIGEAWAINASQLQGTATLRVGSQEFPVAFTATILSLQPGPGQTLVGFTSHFVDFGDGNSFTTMDTISLVPIDTEGNYEFLVKATIIEGTGSFEGATGELTWKGWLDMAVGHAVWRLHGYIQ